MPASWPGQVRDDDGAAMQLLLGYMGLVNAVALLPVLAAMVVANLGNIRYDPLHSDTTT